MKRDSLAILLAAPKKGGEDDEEKEKDDDYGEESKEEDYKALAEEAFPDEDWTPERLSALKQFVMLCAEK